MRVARTDHHFHGTESYAHEISMLLDTLLGASGCTVHAKEALDGRWTLRAADASGATIGATVVEHEHGPLYAAVRLWRLALRARLDDVRPALSPRPRSVEEAQTRVRRFIRQRQDDLDALLDTFPNHQRSRLLDLLRPLGLTFFIGASEEIWGVQDWPMSYIATPETRLLTDAPVEQHGRTTASHFLDGGPAHAAAKDVRKAIEQLTGTSGWLA